MRLFILLMNKGQALPRVLGVKLALGQEENTPVPTACWVTGQWRPRVL